MPTLLLLPGLHGTADLFDRLLAVLPAELPRRILTYPVDRCLSYDAHRRRFESELAGHDDVILFAESFSGPLAIELAADHPGRVRALILCGTFVTHPVPRLLCYLATVPILLRFPVPAMAIRMFMAGMRGSRELVADTRRAIRAVEPGTMAHRVRQAAWLDGCDALARCRVPILCLAGTRDRVVGARSVRRLRRIRPDVPVRLLDAPHLLLQSRPAEVWQHVAAFLDTLPAPPPRPPAMLSPAPGIL